MAIQTGEVSSARQQLLQRTARERKNEQSYKDIAAVLDKITDGQQRSADTALMQKLTNRTDADRQTLVDAIKGNSNYTQNIKLTTKVQRLVKATQALAAQKEQSLFLKSRPTTKEAEEAFTISCVQDGTDFTLDVKQLAKAQKNTGNYLAQQEVTKVKPGRQILDLTLDGKTTSIAFRVEEGDTNEAVVKKTAESINRADCGVKAETVTQDGQVWINLECTATGAPVQGQEQVFYFTQEKQTGLLETLGLNQISQKGENAVFNFNNAEEDTVHMYNSALINGNISVDFKTVTQGPVKVSFTYDMESIAAAVQEYVDAYNAVKQEIAECSYKAVKNYFKQMQTEYAAFEDRLQAAGVSLNAEGNLVVNDGKLYLQNPKELAAVWNDPEKGYAGIVQEKAEKLSSYMDRLSGKTKKYYGLKAKKSNAALRKKLAQKENVVL